jgi:cytoskeletal protein RodZ
VDDSLAFTVVPVIIGAVFVLVLGVIIVAVVKGWRQWSRNNASPVETVRALVVTKRMSVRSGSEDSPASTSHHVTFELTTGVREEFGISGPEYGQLAEGDRGMLTRQGTRYKGFVRDLTGSAL